MHATIPYEKLNTQIRETVSQHTLMFTPEQKFRLLTQPKALDDEVTRKTHRLKALKTQSTRVNSGWATTQKARHRALQDRAASM
jgi:hypothetical protein